MRNYVPPENDHLSTALKDIIPEKYRGTDRFLDVVAWNIRFFHDRDPERVSRIVDILEALNADVMVLEEILGGSLTEVTKQLSDRKAGNYEAVYGETGGNQRVSIMYDLDWVRAKDSIKELFGKNSVVTADGKDAFPRLPLHSYFTVLSEIEEAFDLQVVGLHLKSQRGGGQSQRQMAAERLKTWLIREAPIVDSDAVLIGDWNEPPKSNTWEPIHELERKKLALFTKINDSDSISHLMYKNLSNTGSRLDMAAVSISSAARLVGKSEVARWKSLDDLLKSTPTSKEIKKYIKETSQNISDHMPVVVRFYLQEPNH